MLEKNKTKIRDEVFSDDLKWFKQNVQLFKQKIEQLGRAVAEGNVRN